MALDQDRALLDAFRKGERLALERVYRLHVGPLSRFLAHGFSFESGGRTVRFVGATSTFHLEDWVHEVFLRAFDEGARTRYDGVRPFGAYLERIARNLVLDELRRKEHKLRVHVEEVPEASEGGDFDGPAAPPSPHSSAEQTQLAAHVREFVASLPERERAIYEARFVEEREQRDIAARLKLTPSKVKTSEGRIRAAFRRYLIERGWLDASAEAEENAHA